MNQNQVIKGAIKNLIGESKKKILIPNAIITLTANLEEASENKDFYLIDYEKYAKQIIDNSELSVERKEEIRHKFKKPPLPPKETIAEPIKEKSQLFSNLNKQTNDETTPSPLKIRSSSPTLVNNNVEHYEDLRLNPPKFQKIIICRACNKPIDGKCLIYYSVYPYHNYCIKCMKCLIMADISEPKSSQQRR